MRTFQRTLACLAAVVVVALPAGCSGDGDDGGGASPNGTATADAPSTTVDTTPPSPESYPDLAAVTSCPAGLVVSVDRGYGMDPTRECEPNPVQWFSGPAGDDGVVLVEPLAFQTLDSRNVFSPVVFQLTSVRIAEDCTGTALRSGPEGPEVVYLDVDERDGTVRMEMFLDPPGTGERRPVGRLDFEVQEAGFFDERCGG